jgi:hypothetical protein
MKIYFKNNFCYLIHKKIRLKKIFKKNHNIYNLLNNIKNILNIKKPNKLIS